MTGKTKTTRIMDAKEIKRTLLRLSHEILEKNPNTEDLAVIGIRARGDYLAERISGEIKKLIKKDIDVGAMDITMYRDDLTEVAENPVIHATDIPFDINGKVVILIDDVLFTGRTVRCALDELIDYGRPASIQLAVLVDRGHRELPIRPDFTGKNIPTARTDNVEVRVEETDEIDEVIMQQGEEND